MAFLDSCNLLVIEDSPLSFDIVDYKQVYRGINYYLTNHNLSEFMFVAADKTASRNSGLVYISSNNGFYIIDLNKKEVVDVITKTHSKVSVKDKLKQEDIVDLNIGGNPILA
jgi:hypothetical protein